MDNKQVRLEMELENKLGYRLTQSSELRREVKESLLERTELGKLYNLELKNKARELNLEYMIYCLF